MKRTGKETGALSALMTYQEKVFLICLGFSRNSADAEDLAQEVYLKALKNIETLKDPKLSKIWLFRIARNVCLDFKKRYRRSRMSQHELVRSQMEPLNPELQMIHSEQLRLLKGAIHQLPKKQREVFILKEYGDLSYEEIAATLHIKEGTVMSRLNRARQTVMNRMRGENHDKREYG
ncbi:MAG: RNA polymerase sigma factor [Candidatus Aminicenantales bacterium]